MTVTIGGTQITFNDNSVQTTAAPVRAWVNFDGTGSVSTNQTVRGSFNVSSVFKNGTGDFTINFLSSLTDANYATVGIGINGTSTWGVSLSASVAPTASAVRIRTQGETAFGNPSYVNVAVFR